MSEFICCKLVDS